MKRILKSIVERMSGAKLHADHAMIKGKKSGGSRDVNGKDWRKVGGEGGGTVE